MSLRTDRSRVTSHRTRCEHRTGLGEGERERAERWIGRRGCEMGLETDDLPSCAQAGQQLTKEASVDSAVE